MVKNDRSALGVIFPNSYDNLVPQLARVRLMASIPFASRYRMIDFQLSSMVNSGIENIAVAVNNNYHSLMDHLGSGREWDLVRKSGGLHIFPPFADGGSKIAHGRVELLAGILGFLRAQTEKYVVMCDSNIAINFDYKALIDAHIETGADVTMVYAAQELPEVLSKDEASGGDMYYTMNVEEDGRISRMFINLKKPGVHNLSLNMYVIEREKLIDMVNAAYVRGYPYFERDILSPNLEKYKVYGYKYDGYKALIADLKSYFDENMKLLNDENLDGLFGSAPVYTKIRDDNPTRYIAGATVRNTMAADGCVIEGEVENSVLFRGVKIGKGAVVKNCVLMQDTVVEDGAQLEYVVTDKDALITAGKSLKGENTYPTYIGKKQTV